MNFKIKIYTSNIFVAISATQLDITSCVPIKLKTLSPVPGKKSLFCENLILTPSYLLCNSAITDPLFPIIEPVTIYYDYYIVLYYIYFSNIPADGHKNFINNSFDSKPSTFSDEKDLYNFDKI